MLVAEVPSSCSWHSNFGNVVSIEQAFPSTFYKNGEQEMLLYNTGNKFADVDTRRKFSPY